MGDEGRVAPLPPMPHSRTCLYLVLVVPPAPILCSFVPTLVCTPALPSHPLTLVCLSLCLFGPPTLPLYLAAVVVVVATAAPAAATVAAAAAPAACCRCCCSAVTIAAAAVVAAVVAAIAAAADAAAVAAAAACTCSLSLVLWLACAHPLFYLWCLSTTIYL